MKNRFLSTFLLTIFSSGLFIAGNGEQASPIVNTVPDSASDTAVVPPAQKQAVDENRLEEDFESDKRVIDVLLDVSMGASLTRFTVTDPDYISTRGKPDFTFSMGLMLPFAKRFFADVSFRFMRLRFSLSQSLFSSGTISTQTVTINTKSETMNFISLPVLLGMRFEIKRFIPYFYLDCIPAYLTAGAQNTVIKTETVFSDGVKMTSPAVQDINTTNLRQRYQIALGGGIGLEWLYGYGSIYMDGSIQTALREPDAKNDKVSLPMRRSSRLTFFPISLGLRFFL
jgi:hypothetical protein